MIVLVPAMSPHDVLIKAMFSRVELAAEEIAYVLPADVASLIDMRTLDLVATSVIEVRDHCTDFLYSAAAAGRSAFIHVLFETQAPDASLLLRLWRCLGAIWQRHARDEHALLLPPIVSIVIHHGPVPCPGPTTVAEIVDVTPALAQALGSRAPAFGFYLDDLAAEDDDALRARPVAPLLRLALWALKNASHGRDLAARLQPWADDIQRVVCGSSGTGELSMVMRYLLDASDVDPDALEALLGEVGLRARDAYMTAADLLRKRAHDQGRDQGRIEGRAQGRAAGRVEERRCMLVRVLEQRFGLLPEDVRAHIDRSDADVLLRVLDRAVTAPSLGDAVGALAASSIHE